MPESKKRQRKLEKPLKELRRAIRADIELISQWLVIPIAPVFRRELEEELFRLSDPFCPGYMEAPIPSHRGDLRRTYISFHLFWQPGDPSVEDVMAPELVPIPTDDVPSAFSVAWHPKGPSYDDSVRAFRSMRRRRGLPT